MGGVDHDSLLYYSLKISVFRRYLLKTNQFMGFVPIYFISSFCLDVKRIFTYESYYEDYHGK